MKTRFLNWFEVLVIVAFAVFPLLFVLPFRSYIYLSWEGAYRLSEGQLPFKDFGLPLGGMYWVVPALFFKIFGVQVITLLKAQAFLNIVAGLAFRSILKTLKVSSLIILPAVLLFCLSYSFQNFWPWYNHSVIVYGIVALSFLLKAFFAEGSRQPFIYAILAGFFTFFSIFTKHDGGGLFFILCGILSLYVAWVDKKWRLFFGYVGATLIFTILLIVFFSQYSFSYWFNYGQQPHSGRLSAPDLIDEFLGASQWIKFYLFIVLLLMVLKIRDWSQFVRDKQFVLFSLLTLGILALASIIQITSYTPSFGNYFLHSFAVAFILDNIVKYASPIPCKKLTTVILCLGVLLWWSNLPWEYAKRMVIKRTEKTGIYATESGENAVGIHNFILPGNQGNEKTKPDSSAPNEVKAVERQSQWVTTDIPILKRVTIPKGSWAGIQRIQQLDIVKEKSGRDLKVLNMSELTFLAAVIPYELERNSEAPLWHHLGVGMFNKQLHLYQNRIEKNYYDLVVFEYVPSYNNLFPFAMRDTLQQYYEKVDSFVAPRSGSKPGVIEVYIKKRATAHE